MPDRILSLTILESGSGSGGVFTFHVRLDDDVVASNQSLTVAQSQAVRELSVRYGQLFEQRGPPQLAREELTAIGAQLFEFWLAPSWPKLSSELGLGDQRILVVGSDRASILNLPWELLRPAAGEAIGADARWSVRRLPWADRALDAAAAQLPPGPLRVLYMVSAPRDQAELDFEREEERLLRAFGKAGGNVVFDSGDLGSFEELGQRIVTFRPHIVHLTGHGVTREDTAYFAFEDERGQSDLRPASELGQLFAGSGVQCAFLSACQAGKAPSRAALGGLAQGLVAEGVPLVIGWTASILDDVATEVAASFYAAVSPGHVSVDRALVTARQAVRKMCEERGDPSWSLPVLYAGTRQTRLFDTTRTEAGSRPSLMLHALPGFVAGYTPHFIGRRRELQRLLPGLRAGELQAVVLTGLGGAGKSTLATRLVLKLKADGWTPIALSSSTETPLSAGQLLTACGQAFLDAGQRDIHTMLGDATLGVADRLRAIVAGLNRGRFVLVLDNFESNLDEGTRRILDAELAGFYRYLFEQLVGGSRLIITSRFLPADMPQLPPTVTELQLGEFSEAAFLKFLLRDTVVERRYRKGELPHGLLVRLHQSLGATPRFLDQIRKVLVSLPADDLKTELDRIALPSEGEEAAHAGRLQAVRDAYCETIFTGRLYGRLSLETQRMLSQAAVFGLAVPVEGLAAVAGASAPEMSAVREAAAQWRSLALAHMDASGGRDLWSVYGMLRSWLLSPERLPAEACQAAHRAAGDYLVRLNKEDREGELGVNWVACLLEARAQYLAAGALELAREVTGQISGSYVRQGLYVELERLNAELLEVQAHSETLNWLGRAHLMRGQYGPARGYYKQALDLAGDADLAGASGALYGLATIDMNEGTYPSAREKFERTLAMFQQTGDRASEAAAWHQLASIEQNKGVYPLAREKLEKALAINQQIADRVGEAAVWHTLASIDQNEGVYSAAREKFERVLAMNQEIGDRAYEAATWHELAFIDLNEGAYPLAREKFERSLAIYQRIDNRVGEASSWHNLASIDQNEGAYSAAREKFERVLAMNQEIGDRASEAAAWHQLASIDLHEGAYPSAREKLQRSLAMHQEIGGRAGEAATWHKLAIIDLRESVYPAAREKFELALAIRQEIGDRPGEAATWHELAFIDLNEGANLSAREKFEWSLAMKQQIGDRAGEALSWHNLASIDMNEGTYPSAREKFERALAMFQQTGDRASEAAAWFQLGQLAAKLGQVPEGLRLTGLCYLIHREIGHGYAESDLRAVTQLATQLDYTQEQLTTVLQNVNESYARDRGAQLLKNAFDLPLDIYQAALQDTKTDLPPPKS
jgi:tetratricopeptide (TPR) repeat protein